LEAQLRELADAERAGVFRVTRLPGETVLLHSGVQSPTGLPRHVRNRAILAVAASVTLAFGVWTWMFVSHISDIRERTAMIDAPDDTIVRDQAPRFSSNCMTGPSETADDPCLANDLDADGSITLADFRAFQLAPSGSPH
jgi:hypothetical protein